ncbi:MAG: cell division protein FtsZ [Oscillospiraceae bacterium]
MAPFELDSFTDDFEAPDDYQMSAKIMVFGVGGGGGNAVAHMVGSGVEDVYYTIANTDVAALRQKDRSKIKCIQIGRKTTKGRGAGNNPTVGKASAEENRDDIAAQLQDVSMLFVTAGMGGGTGTGAAPIVASVAKEMGILTVGVVTKPFGFEGPNKMEQALAGISEMKKYVDALIVIPNQRLMMLKGQKLSLKNAFGEVDNVLCRAVLGVIKLLQGSGYMNVDFADVCMALRDSGIAHMAIGNGKGENKLDDALDEVLNSPLLETSIDGARRGLLNISVPESFPLEEYESLMNDISEKFNSEARFKCGIVFDDTLADDELSLIVVATDFVEEDSPVMKAPVAPTVAPVEKAPAPAEEAAAPAPEPTPTPTPAPDGFSGFGSFSTDTNDMDALLRKFNQGRDV